MSEKKITPKFVSTTPEWVGELEKGWGNKPLPIAPNSQPLPQQSPPPKK